MNAGQKEDGGAAGQVKNNHAGIRLLIDKDGWNDCRQKDFANQQEVSPNRPHLVKQIVFVS